MQLKKWYYIATNVSSRKSATTSGDLPDWQWKIWDQYHSHQRNGGSGALPTQPINHIISVFALGYQATDGEAPSHIWSLFPFSVSMRSLFISSWEFDNT